MADEEKDTSVVELQTAVVDFNQAVLDADDKPIMESDMDEKQAVKAQRLQLIISNRTTPVEEAKEAFDELAELRKATEQPIALGLICCSALRSADEKADGTQILKRENLARLIQGSPAEDDFAILGVEKMNSKKKTMIEKCVENRYGKTQPHFYIRVYEALEGNTDADDE